ncbi:hypothetical protein SEMRO_1964_G308160.1 [Seminavis robusta]|uniref:Uncharacterized protein n=1 Tax=Seminavis robusta TaxID=568900 RepID=A0A9N8HTY7_9STRA|nr:hypothetical protein SEMRO_1964_G308160.1 [Seminavis robusta]|eukprot:Sro1964_g308160.1 n/a (101) ;mRNA; f:4155-4457
MLRDTAQYLGILNDCKENGKVPHGRLISVVIEDFFEDPIAYRIRQNSTNEGKEAEFMEGDQLDDLSAASFNVADAMDGYDAFNDGFFEEDIGILDHFNVD